MGSVRVPPGVVAINKNSTMAGLIRTDSMYQGTPEMAEFRKEVARTGSILEGWGAAVPFQHGNGSYNSDHQNKLTEFNNAHWYPYKHKVYQEWELTFRSIMCFRGDNPYADYSMMGSFEDLARFFWSGMSYNDRKRFLEGVYFGKFYTEVEDMEDEWEIENSNIPRSVIEY